MVDLGGYKMHLWCTGKGAPTIVLSAGSGDFSFDWYLVQTEVAKTTRVCSYDRGREARSDLGPSPLTARQEAFDLRRALHAAGLFGPYVLVGHSLGGFIDEVFVSQYPRDVAGIVLVDATGWNSLMNINGKQAPLREFTQNRTIPTPRSHVTVDDALSPDAIEKIQAFVKQYNMVPSIEPPFDKLPAQEQTWRLWALAKPSHWAATQDAYFGEQAQELYLWAGKATHPLGNLPLIVLSRKTPDKPGAIDLDHETHQHELVALSGQAELIFVPNTGHHIQLDQPDAVTSAIARILLQVRSSKR
jgi:pimeloyl-ACP methyl ester carboxylesterase